MTPVVVGVIVEDLPFAKFLDPAMRALAGARGLRVRPPLKTRGCRPRKLRELLQGICGECDLVIVGADARHGTRPVSHRRKSREIGSLVEQDPLVLPSIAEPSIEAWLYCDPRAFSDGVRRATGSVFEPPEHWPKPKSERLAKEQLGRLVTEGCGGPQADVFDFAPEIVAGMDLTRAPNASLAAWARAFVTRLERCAP